MSQTIN